MRPVWVDADVNAVLVRMQVGVAPPEAWARQYEALLTGRRWVRYDLERDVAGALDRQRAAGEDTNDVLRRLMQLDPRDKSERVGAGACESCGMDEIDELLLEDDAVQCGRCGSTYLLEQPRPYEPPDTESR